MKCPKCNAPMELGSAVVEGSVGGFFIFGFSHQNLEFKGKNGVKIVLPSNSKTQAYRCETCRLTLIEEETNAEKKAARLGRTLGKKYAQWKHRKNKRENTVLKINENGR